MKLFKSYSEKEVKRVMPIVEKINSMEKDLEKLSDEKLKAKTDYFKKELKEKCKKTPLPFPGKKPNPRKSASMPEGG